VYSFGVGFDVKFEEAVLARTDCLVFSFDPTPAVVELMQSQAREERWQFYPWGIASSSRVGELVMSDASLLEVEGRQAMPADVFQVRFFSLPHIMRELGHERVDVVKLDVEGMEVEVLEGLEEETLRSIGQLVVELHVKELLPILHLQDVVELEAERGGGRWIQLKQKLAASGFLLFHVAPQTYFSQGLCFSSSNAGAILELSFLNSLALHLPVLSEPPNPPDVLPADVAPHAVRRREDERVFDNGEEEEEEEKFLFTSLHLPTRAALNSLPQLVRSLWLGQVLRRSVVLPADGSMDNLLQAGDKHQVAAFIEDVKLTRGQHRVEVLLLFSSRSFNASDTLVV